MDVWADQESNFVELKTTSNFVRTTIQRSTIDKTNWFVYAQIQVLWLYLFDYNTVLQATQNVQKTMRFNKIGAQYCCCGSMVALLELTKL